jgi:cation transport ATPase
VRRYGFHGLSHAWAARRAQQLAPHARRVVTCHLGAGASLAAVLDGRSVDTTKGFTPLDGAEATLRAQFAAGSRVVAVASRAAPELTVPTPADENDLTLVGFLIFLDRPKAAAAASLQRLAALGITVKVCTGDNPLVARRSAPRASLLTG